MTTRRRRVFSETEQEPLIVVTGDYKPQHRNDVEQYNSYGASLFENMAETKDDTFRPTMTSRDRTTEFINTVRLFQNRQMIRPNTMKDMRKNIYLQSYTEFMTIARAIGKNISSTFTKLEKLTLLAKQKSLFNDRPQEIEQLTYIIKEDLNSLNQHIARLQEVSRLQQRLSKGRHLQSHSSNVVVALQLKLASISTDFKQVLEVRTDNLRQQRQRQNQFSSSDVAPSHSGHHRGSSLLQDQQALAIDMDNQSYVQSPMQRQATMSYDDTENYLQSRAETMQNIESTIVELGGIFQQLAHMVKEQEEMVERIDTNVQETELNVDAAHGEILKYFKSVTSNRWLMIKIFAVLIFFSIFVIIFMA